MANEGYIKLYRKMMKWGWYTDTNAKCVFLHLLFLAAYEPCFFKGIKLEPGQAVASVRQIATDTNISVKSVRVALDHLKRTQEVAQSVHGKFSVFTVNNYSDYQCEGTIDGKQMANKGQTEGKHPDIKKNKEIPPYPPQGVAAAVDEGLKKAVEAYQENIGTLSRVTADRLKGYLEEFDVELVVAAIEEAAAQNKRSLTYLSAILKRCRNTGVKTAAEFAAEKAAHERKPREEVKTKHELTIAEREELSRQRAAALCDESGRSRYRLSAH